MGIVLILSPNFNFIMLFTILIAILIILYYLYIHYRPYIDFVISDNNYKVLLWYFTYNNKESSRVYKVLFEFKI